MAHSEFKIKYPKHSLLPSRKLDGRQSRLCACIHWHSNEIEYLFYFIKSHWAAISHFGIRCYFSLAKQSTKSNSRRASHYKQRSAVKRHKWYALQMTQWHMCRLPYWYDTNKIVVIVMVRHVRPCARKQYEKLHNVFQCLPVSSWHMTAKWIFFFVFPFGKKYINCVNHTAKMLSWTRFTLLFLLF